MTQNTGILTNWFLADTVNEQIKNGTASLKDMLNRYLCIQDTHISRPDELRSLCLSYLIDCWCLPADALQQRTWFSDWSAAEQQVAVDFFSDPHMVHLINATFFYKLYPEKLFHVVIHPEKLVSVRTRLGFLHERMELIQQHLFACAMAHGVRPGVDLLFHGDELPDGILVEVDETLRAVIQTLVKQFKVKSTPESEERITLERVQDLGRAYKFWFNPHRLIDAVMVLHQRLVNKTLDENSGFLAFYQQMLLLYQQLTTTECLNLYGHFSNNDTRYLLHAMLIAIKETPVDWLPELKKAEKKALEQVFQALQCVMEALREALRTRHASTRAYIYGVQKPDAQVGQRNRDAILHIISVYGGTVGRESTVLEALFSTIEEC